MGIYDRDYYRRDRRAPDDGPHDASVGGLTVTTWLVLLNVLAFVLTTLVDHSKNPQISEWWARNLLLWPVFGEIRAESLGVAAFRPWQVPASMFMHASFLHILFNMWFLWMFGKAVERLTGPWNFLVFYVVAGGTAALLFVLTSALRGDPRPALGASGAVMGVVVLYAFHFPRERILVWGVVPVLVWQFAAFYVGMDLILFVGAKGGNVAHAAHLGGAFFGAVYRFVDLRLERLLGRLRPGPKAFAPPPASPPPPLVDPDVRERVDALLDKISRQGLSALTDEERDFLRDASRRY